MYNSGFRFIFIGIFIVIFTIYSYQVDITSEYQNQTEVYKDNLKRACEASIDETQLNYEKDMPFLFNTKEKREYAVERFFQALERGFNYESNSDYAHELKLKVPVICLIDSDGFYIVYNAPYRDENSNINVVNTVTQLYPWTYTENSKNYAVRFFLSDYVEITDLTTGEIKTGSYQSLYNLYGQSEFLDFLGSKESFEEQKNLIIVSSVKDTLEYYLNTYNLTVNSLQKDKAINSHELKYTLDLAYLSGTEWGNLIQEPTTMAFLQGMQVNNTDRLLNIYAMAGGELVKNNGYIITEGNDGLLYHRQNCQEIITPIDYGLTKEQCAKKGAFPCFVCRP